MLLNFAVATIISLGAAVLPVHAATPSLTESLSGPRAVLSTTSTSIAPRPVIPAAPVKTGTTLGVFGSVAISAARIPAARKWQDVQSTDFSAYFGDDCLARGFSGCDSRFATRIRSVRGAVGGSLDPALLDEVNRTVNGAMTYKPDSAVWGVGDYWATPAEMAAKGAGDCEDFAIAKYWLLRSIGVPDDRLQMVLLQDTRRQLFHAVLVVHTASGAYVLDNVTNRLRLDTDYGQYQPIMSFSGGRNYIHGFAGGRATTTAMPSDLSAVAPGLGM